MSGIQVPPEKLRTFGERLARSIAESLSKREQKATLRMSNIGKPCERQLWYEINLPHTSEQMRPETYMKFMYGNLVEELVLFLAELAGHEVKGQQDEVEIQGVKGHRDVVIDGTLVDAKSASSFSFKKFKSGLTKETDAFGYIPQIQSYLDASQDDPEVKEKDKAAFLVVDKTLGHITLDVHPKDDVDWPKLFDQKKEMIAKSDPPPRGFEPEPMGKSGNMKLGTNCSYCPFKAECYPDLRVFSYSFGPVFLVDVKKEPNVPEVDKVGGTPDEIEELE